MRLFPEFRNRIRLLIFGVPVTPQTAVRPNGNESATPAKAGRPISAALTRTVDALSRNPAVTASELAETLSVTPSYARTLLRRARARRPEPAVESRGASIHRLAAVTPQPGGATPSLQDLSMRIAETEKSLATLRSMPMHSRGSLNLNRRAEVLRLTEAGHHAADIAQRLGIPAGEVDFVLKIDCILNTAAQAR